MRLNHLRGIGKDIRTMLRAVRASRLDLHWKRRAGWLGTNLPGDVFDAGAFPGALRIERLAAATDRLGEFSLHASYGQSGATRTPETVRSSSEMGRFYRSLVIQRRPGTVVEFGTAFGVSGMYWLAGLEANGHGGLLTFEINEEWRKIAVGNLSRIGTRFRSVAGSFEHNVDAVLEGRKIDIALIDGIHTSEWVLPQYELVLQRLAPGGLILFDDIDFSGDMRSAWETVSGDPRVIAAVAVSDRLGVIELSPGVTTAPVPLPRT